jgi:hypothetical protein
LPENWLLGKGLVVAGSTPERLESAIKYFGKTLNAAGIDYLTTLL